MTQQESHITRRIELWDSAPVIGWVEDLLSLLF